MNNEISYCARCKTTSSILVAHHMDFNHANDSPNNLLILCSKCHRDLHNKKWKLEDIGIHTPDKLTEPVPKHVLTDQQVHVVDLIEKLEEHFGDRWFVQAELENITLHTMKALVEKGYLDRQRFNGLSYYKLKG